MKTQITIPRDWYETLHLSSLAYGGIGAGRWEDHEGVPVCVAGHLNQQGIPFAERFATGLRVTANDHGVRCINQRKGRDPRARVSFEEYVAELNIVPDDSGVEYGTEFITA